MTTRRTVLLLALMMVWLCPLYVLAQPSIHGPLSGTLGPGTYIVDGDCQVLSGNTLIIEPRTTFLFSGHYTFNIYGTIQANGTEAEMIEFIRQYPTEACRWGGIRFQSGAPGNSVLSYCLIDNCKNISYPNYYGGGLYSSGVTVQVEHTTISNCQASSGGGFYGTGGANVSFIDCIITSNWAGNGGGLYYYGASGQISDCIVIKNNSTST
ncbi:MAG: hypothetical protein H8E87_00585 [FCB group bacterium]|nr:hypothetical protein [FCB group bacterium]